jgi:hypothetical protein
MARPPKFKKGPMSAAERMRRYRARQKEIKIVNDATLTQARNRRKRLTNERNPLAQWRHAAINAQLQVSVLENRLHAYEQAPLNLDRRASAADELARQIAEFMRECPGLTIEDVRNAIDRRFGLSPPNPIAETLPASAR